MTQQEALIAIPQQDEIKIDASGDSVTLTQRRSFDGSEEMVFVTSKENLGLLITALQKAWEAM